MSIAGKSVKQRIFEIIREREPISRARLARDHHTRAATVTETTRELLESGVIVEAGEENSTGGRPPSLLRINWERFQTVGVHLQDEQLCCGLFSSGARFCRERVDALSPGVDDNGLNEAIIRSIEALIIEAEVPPGAVRAIGAAFPGWVDSEQGVYRGDARFPNVREARVRAALEQAFDVPVTIDHEAMSALIAERALDDLPESRDMGAVLIGRTVSSRFALDGRIYRGVSNSAGDFADFFVRGAMVSIPAIVAAFNVGRRRHAEFSEIVSLAEGGDAKALDVLARAGRGIGAGVAAIFRILDIDLIVIAGEIALAEPFVAGAVRETLEAETRGIAARAPRRVAFSRLNIDGALNGAALQAARLIYAESGVELCEFF